MPISNINEQLNETNGSKSTKLNGIPGSKHTNDCTLMVTDENSAKLLVLSGFSMVDHDHYGVLALRGKLSCVPIKRETIAFLAQVSGWWWPYDLIPIIYLEVWRSVGGRVFLS